MRWWGGSVEDSWWETFTTYDGLASDYISAIAVDAQGNAWVGTEYDGLSARRAADGAWTTHHIRNSDLASNDISALAVDAQGDAWCGHNWSGVTFIPQEAGQEPRRTSPWKVFTSEDGLASDEVSVIAVDGQGNAWAGTAYDGLSVRWAADGSWSTYTSEDGLAGYDISAVAVDAPDDVWVGTRYDGLSVRRADDGSWSTYTFEDGLASNYVSALAVDALGNVWVGTEWSGLSVRWAADGYWSTYTTDDGLASDDVSAIAVTPDGDVWVGHPWSGVSRLSGGVWTTYGYETLVSEYVTALAVAPNGAVWVGTEDGISVYTPADDQWTNYPQYDTIWLGDNVAAIAFESDGDTWIGFEQAGTVWVAADLGDWERYTSEERDGPASNYVKDIALDGQGNVWFATPVYGGGGEAYDHRGVGLARPVRQGSGEYGGVTLYRPSTSLVLWSYETEMSAAGQKIVELAVGLTAAELGTTGKLYLEGDLIAQTGQRLDDDRQPFYVFATETALTLSTDKAIYRPDEGVVIGGAVINRSASSLNGQTLTVTLDGDTLYTEGPFDVPAGGSHPYSITTNTPQDPGAVTLAATLGDVVVQDRVTVAEPQVSADVLVPDVVGRAPFSVTVVLNNIGSVDADLVVTVDEGAPHSLALPAGQRNLVKESLTIADDADVAVEITGDLVQTTTHHVVQGETVNLVVAPAASYYAGRVAVPYTLTNAGELVSTTPVTFSVDGTTIVREHTTLPGQILDGELMLDLSASDYALVYATPLESGQVTLHVTDPQLDRVQIAALSVPGDVGANTALSVTLVNVGDNRVEGVLRLATTFSEEYHPFELDSDSAQTVETLLSSATAEESGAYELVAQVRVNGQVVDEAAAGFVVAPPHFVVTAPSEIDVTAGQATTLLFGVQNTGGLASEATLTVDLDGIDIANQETWLAPGEAITLTYPFSIPFDLDSGQRQGSYAIAGITTTFDYQVEGYELSMTAQTDKPLYEAGETAVVTLYVNDDAGLGHPLIARLNGGGVESSQTFTPTGSAQLVFTATAGHEDDLLSYGLYAVSGRSLLLNTLRLRVRGGEIGLFTDKGVYQSGETVHLTVDALVSGTLSLRAPGLEDERHVEAGQTAIAFTLPNDMRAGTYEIEYRFNSREGSYLFEVEGLQVAVTEVVLGKRSYVAQDTVAATLQVMSNQDLPGTSVAWQVLNPQGEVLASADTPVNLTQGRNEVNLGALAFESTHAGTHALSFQVNDGERPLASGTELFDVTGPTLLGVYVPRAAYHAGRPIEVIFSTLGEGEASLRLWLNDNFINEAPVTLDGYGRAVVILGGLPIGVHQLEAELSGDGLTSKGATTVVVLDLPQVSIAAPNPSGEAGWYKEWPPRADLGASEEDAVILYHWDDEADAYNVGLPLVPAEGEHTLYAHAEGSDGATGPETARTFRVDTVPPETLVEIAGTQHEEGWYASPVTVTFVVSDATSGWAWSAYRLVGETDWLFYTQPFILSEDGTYILEYRSADVAGNEGATQTLEVTVVYGNDAPEATDDEATTDKIPPSR